MCEYVAQNGHAPAHTVDGSENGAASASSPSDRRQSANALGSPDEPAAKRVKPTSNSYAVQYPPRLQAAGATEHNTLLGLTTPVPPPIIPGQNGRETELEARSRQSTVSGADEVAEVYTETRMLQDPTGRLRMLRIALCPGRSPPLLTKRTSILG